MLKICRSLLRYDRGRRRRVLFPLSTLQNDDTCFVSTWSPLAYTFNAKQSEKLRERFARKSAGLFGIEALREPTGFYLMKQDAMVIADRLLLESRSPGRRRKMVEIFDELSDTLCKVADMGEFVRLAHPDHEYRTAAEDACVSINMLVEQLNTDFQLYTSLRDVIERGDVVATDEVDDHVTRLFLVDFEQSGIHLSADKRERVVALNEEILQLGSQFMQSTFTPRAVAKKTLPAELASCFPNQGDKVIVSGLYSDSSNDLIRDIAYRIYMHPDSGQERHLHNLLKCRAELANLCGFPSFAHRTLRGSLAETPETVLHFLDALSEELRPRAEVDFDLMRNLKTRRNVSCNSEDAAQIQMWDTPYLSALVKQQMFDMQTLDMGPYLSLGGCMEGLSRLLQCLYDVQLEVVITTPGEVWASDVHKLAVVHRTEGILGYVYCDLLERPGKPNQDCHFTIRGGRTLPDGTYQLPVVVLLLNFPPPTWSKPSLLSPGMVENLFHEMGHAMHSMLARTKYQHVTGTRCSTDFAEVPSVLMEYFASDARVLSSFARDYRNGNAIPLDILEELSRCRGTLCASDLQLQVFYSMLDQHYHGVNFRPDQTTTEELATIQDKYYSIPHVPGTAWQLRFGHLVGYGAKYYSYVISKAVASWIWQQEFERDPFNRIAGERYRQHLLSHGGGRPPKQILRDFLGQVPTPDILVRSLLSEIDVKQDKYRNRMVSR